MMGYKLFGGMHGFTHVYSMVNEPSQGLNQKRRQSYIQALMTGVQ